MNHTVVLRTSSLESVKNQSTGLTNSIIIFIVEALCREVFSELASKCFKSVKCDDFLLASVLSQIMV